MLFGFVGVLLFQVASASFTIVLVAAHLFVQLVLGELLFASSFNLENLIFVSFKQKAIKKEKEKGYLCKMAKWRCLSK